MMPNAYDLVVIGTGAGGAPAALKCANAGWTVAIVDSRPYGGTCALRGCDPKKVLVGGAQPVDWVRRMQGHGVAGDVALRWQDLMAFKRTFTNSVPEQRRKGLEKAGIDTYHGRARFVDEESIVVGEERLRARHILLANGAKPAPLPFEGADLLKTSTEFLELEELPERLVFVGGGFISMEFAHVALRAGAQVTIIEFLPRPLEGFDPNLVDRLVETTRELGADVYLDTKVTRIERQGEGFRVFAEADEEELAFEADLVVHGAGRVPDLDDMELEQSGVERGKGGVTVNEYLQSVSNPRVYAAGDAAESAGLPLTPVASMESQVAGSNLLDGNHRQPDYTGVPAVVFAEPPLALAGLTEEEAAKEGYSVDVKQGDMTSWYTYRRVRARTAAYKVLLDRDRDIVLGAHLLGPGADELINLFAVAIRFEIPARELMQTIFAYPTHASDVAYML